MNETILALIGFYAGMYGIDPAVALSVAQVESGLNPKAVGTKGEVGLYQIMPSTYPEINRKALFEPKVNIELGIKYLAWTKKYCKHKENKTWLVCYNYGIKNAERVKYPHLFPYYKKVMRTVQEFKDGQKVMIKNLYEMRLDGEGIYKGVSRDHHNTGKLRIEVENGLVMAIEPERVVKYEEYWKR